MNAVGCDLSRYNVSFNPYIATGRIDFAIQKATQGYSYIDLEYEGIWQGVSKIPIRGAYHYLMSGLSWAAQADHFLRTASRHDYHIYALDVEEIGNEYTNEFFSDAKRIVDYWRKNSNKKVIIYTNSSTYNSMYYALLRIYGQSITQWLNGVPLWLASPALPGKPYLPRTRSTWDIHQYSWSGQPSRWGTGGTRVDENVFNGTVEMMNEWLTSPVSTPTGTGGNMLYGRVNTGVLNVRSGPDAALYPDIGDLLLNDYLVATEAVNGWWRLKSAQRGSWEGPDVLLANGTPIEVRAASTNDVWAKASYIVATAPPPIEPPPTEPTLTHTIQVYSDGSIKIDGNPYP